MRLYTFVNYYLSGIQQGIQSLHVLGDLTVKTNKTYHENSYQKMMFNSWLENHKTVIVCNGGNSKSLQDLCFLFDHPENRYPWAYFCEDEDSLCGAITAVGIVLPQEIYDVKTEIIEGLTVYSYSTETNSILYNNPESYLYQLISTVKSARLAG